MIDGSARVFAKWPSVLVCAQAFLAACTCSDRAYWTSAGLYGAIFLVPTFDARTLAVARAEHSLFVDT